MMSLETALQRCFDRCNLDPNGESVDIYRYMYQYKAIRDLPDDKFEECYDEISNALGYNR